MADSEPRRQDAQGENIPVPDPSLATTRQLHREILALRELLEVKLDSSTEDAELIRKIIETRLDGMDLAIRLLQDTADRFPARIDEKIASLREVQDQKTEALGAKHSEKFSSIQTQFRERDVRTDQVSKDSKVAVDAALQAAKEAVGEQNKSSALAIAKSEAATAKQIDQLGVLFQQTTKAFDDKIGDLKDRLTRIEGGRTGASALWGYLAGAAGLLVSIIVLALRLSGR